MAALDFADLAQARDLVARHLPLLPARPLLLAELAGLVLAESVVAKVASPSVTASTKDGYAVSSREVAEAAAQRPARLELAGFAGAGQPTAAVVTPGKAVRVTTGAALPAGADAVLAREFCREEGGTVVCLAPVRPGQNVYPAGGDVAPAQVVARAGQAVTPALAGLLAAAGVFAAAAHPRPRVGLLATGREVIAPGQPLPAGAVYASNLVTMAAWLELHGLTCLTRVVDDEAGQISAAASELLAGCDALLTSGGAWLSERDLVVGALASLGMDLIFRRVRMGPGKGVALGLVEGKPVFCLPGGPPSNEMAFLQLALPGLLRMAGHPDPGLAEIEAELAVELNGDADWTQFFHGHLEPGARGPVFHPLPLVSRLKAMANSGGIACLPQGLGRLPVGGRVTVQLLGPAWRRGLLPAQAARS